MFTMPALLVAVILCFTAAVYGLPHLRSLSQTDRFMWKGWGDAPGLRARRDAPDTQDDEGRCSNLTGYRACTQQAIRAYQSPLERVFRRMRRGQPIGITQGGFDYFCNAHHSMSNCMEMVPMECRPTTKSEYELIRDAVELACSSGDGILSLQFHSCNTSVNPLLENENCMWGVIRQAVTDLGESTFRQVMIERSSNYCPYLRQSRDCINSTLTTWCGSELTQVLTPIMHELIFTSWDSEFERYGCQINLE